MKRMSLANNLKYLACIMVVTQGILLTLLATFFLNEVYTEKFRNYPSNAMEIKLMNVPEKNEDKTFNFLAESIEKYGLFYAKQEAILGLDGSVNGFEIGVMGQTEGRENELDLDFLDSKVLDKEDITTLLHSTNEEAYLGNGLSSSNRLSKIPYLNLQYVFSIKKMSQVVKERGTINGIYRIQGLTEDNQDNFLKGLCEVSGLDEATFQSQLFGSHIDNSFRMVFLISIVVAHTFVFLSILVVLTIQSLNSYGKLALLGWSKTSFSFHLYKNFVSISLITVPGILLIGIFLSKAAFLTFVFFSTLFLVGLVQILITVTLCFIASFFIWIISALDAIQERYPRKAYLLVTVVVYLLSSAGMVAMSIYIDGPYKEIETNTSVSKLWNQVSDYEIIQSISVGEDQGSFTRQSNKFSADVYEWYKSIEGEKGNYLINTEYYSKSLLSKLQESRIDKELPSNPFWLFTISPNYLKELGLEVTEVLIEEATKGKRLYLLPEGLSIDEKSKLMKWIEEKDKRGIRESDIPTNFNQNQEFIYFEYGKIDPIFTWNTNLENPMQTTNPIIYVATTENMTFRETESLSASGLSNGYIKIVPENKKNILSESYLSGFDLIDNQITFSSTSQFIDGLQKQLWLTIRLFGILLVMVTGISIALLMTLINIYKLIHQESLAVKKFLGYGFIQLYGKLFALICLTVIVELLFSLIFKSKIGFLYLSIMGVIQLGLLYIYLVKDELNKIIEYFQ